MMDLKTIKQNYDCQILFIQQEHANTLKGLHSEIQNLQKRCSELTFQVAMDNTSHSQEDRYKQQCDELEGQVQNDSVKIKGLEAQLEKKDKEVSTLKCQLKAQERKYTDALNTRKTKMDAMNKELESKAGLVARLVTEMHSLKSKLRDPGKQTSSSSPSPSWSDEWASSNMMPLPPSDHPPQTRRRASKKFSFNESVPQIPAVKSRSATQRRGSVDDPAIPDPTPFLVLSREDSLVSSSVGPRHLPLPPISLRSQAKPALSSQVGANKERFTPSPEVEVLAVNKAAQDNVRSAQNYHSDL